MKTIQCAHPPHQHNGFVVTCRLWTTSGGVHALLVLELTETELVETFNSFFSSMVDNLKI